MDRISELLDEAAHTHTAGVTTDIYRWMVEATNRIQELEYKLEAVQSGRLHLGEEIARLDRRIDYLETPF